jgi:hypothetical protein
MRGAGDSHTKSLKCQYSQHWPRQSSTKKAQKAQTWWRSGIRLINCLYSGHILGQYMNNKRSLLYKTWTARLRRRRRRRRRRLLKKRQNAKTICKKSVYILPTQTKTVACYMTDPSSRQGESPTTNKTATALTTAKIWSWVPEGLNAKTKYFFVFLMRCVPCWGRTFRKTHYMSEIRHNCTITDQSMIWDSMIPTHQ